MAVLNPPIPAQNDPSYIGFSRETSGNGAYATAIAGFGKAAVNAVKYQDEIIKENLKKDVSAAVTGLNEELVPGQPSEQPPEQGVAENAQTTEIDVFSEQKTQANVPEVNKATDSAARLTQAYRQGRITPTYYWGRMSTLSKTLKARYPGYTDQIDRQFQGLTGQIPANALANARRKEYTDHLAKISEEEKHFQSLVKQKWVQGHLPADYWQRVREGNPYTKLEVYEMIHRGEAKEAEASRLKSEIALRKSSGELVKDEAIGAATDRMNTISSTVLNSTFSKELVERITTATQNAATGQLPSPEEKQALRSQFALLKAQIQQKQIAALNAPDATGNTYNSLIDDPSKTKAILESGLQELNVIEQLLEDDDFGLFASTINNIKAREQDAKNEVLKIPIWQYLGAIKNTAGAEIYAQMNWDSNIQKQLDQGQRAMIETINAKTVAGEEYPLSQKMQDVNRNAKGSKESVAATNRRLVESSITALSSPKTTQTARVTAATDMFGDGNRNFLLHFQDSPKQQRALYDMMVSPGVTEAMQTVRDTNPELWNKYKDWAKESFLALQRSAAASVQEGFSEREDISLEWDETANQFKYSLSNRGKARANRQSNELFVDVERALNSSVVNSVDNLNKQIKLLENILKVDNENVSEEIAVLLGVLGISSSEKKSPTIFSKARDAVSNKLKELTAKKEGEESTTATD